MAKTKGNNKQVHKSKQWLVEALLTLMETSNFEEITVQEIAQHAQLDRRTFYRHFATKKDVIDYQIDIIFTSYISQLKHEELYEYKQLENHLQFVYQHIDFLRLLKRQNLSELVLKKYNAYVFKFEHDKNKEEKAELNHLMVTSAFKTGGFWNTILYWIDQEPMMSPGELSKILLELINNRLI